MRKKFIVFGSMILCLGAVTAITNTASANRWASLQQNQLIEDKENVYLYPQLLLDYRNSIGFDYGSGVDSGETEQVGTGRVLYLGGWNKFGLGMSARYGSIYPAFSAPIPNDLLSQETSALYLGENSSTNLFPAYSMGSLIGSFAGPAIDPTTVAPPFGIMDAFLAIPTGIGAFGARLGIASRSKFTTYKNDDQEGSGETLLTLAAGLSGKGNVRWDTSLNLAFDFYSNQDEPADAETSGMLIRASVSGRGYIPIANKVDLGILGNLVFSSGAMSSDAGDDEIEATGIGFGVMGGVGPVFRISQNVVVGGYGLLGIAFSALDPLSDGDANDTIADLLIFIPALRIAADIGITDWFFFRGGVQYSFQMAGSSLDEDVTPGEDDEEVESISRGNGQLGLSAGIGFKTIDGFTIDGTLYRGFITDGPYFISGEQRAMFGVVSAAYHW
jgi:hypothetical protein